MLYLYLWSAEITRVIISDYIIATQTSVDPYSINSNFDMIRVCAKKRSVLVDRVVQFPGGGRVNWDKNKREYNKTVLYN